MASQVVAAQRFGANWAGPLSLALAASIWGGLYVVSKVVLDAVPPFALVWIRYAIAVCVLFGAGWTMRMPMRVPWRDWMRMAVVGLVGYALSISAQFLGTYWSTAQMGAVITSTTPAFMVIFGRMMLGEPITWQKGLSVVLATAGVWMIIGLGHLDAGVRLGGWVLVLAALTWALMSVLVKRVPPAYPSWVITAHAMLAAWVAMTPAALWQGRGVSWAVLTRPGITLGILYIGVVSTAIAFFLWNFGLQRVDAGTGGLYFFFQPLTGSLLGWLCLGERVGMSFWAGAALIAAGVALVSLGQHHAGGSERGVQGGPPGEPVETAQQYD
ncbi:MAG: DMT family transporter [Alicyclobacillus macrosporangiidus]|uniref:DMT family transporter n=1 Tax=Alicyclobacillus macrosporangiidus TaxID=392015 RepID=UPI0026F2A4F4|nr:EamA family transporter [Alicyclobacillus macrosporangiidus]MCL6599403.1 DMT family transporter [Alicyclobacillus macrosporangiidus]